MKLTRPPRTRRQRALARAPIWLYRNVLEDPRVCFQVGWRRYVGLARPLGQEVDGSEAAYRRVGSDRDHGIALVALSLW